jgi:hypothetical protein
MFHQFFSVPEAGEAEMTGEVVIVIVLVLPLPAAAAAPVGAGPQGGLQQRRRVYCGYDTAAFGANNAAGSNADHFGAAAPAQECGWQLFRQRCLGVSIGLQYKIKTLNGCRTSSSY